ncbi:DegT/DnrJ/EryC1/StrS family aminotransferase [Candidatus Hepatobacter penaei]|uniref:DegT/DnrJ/EryC1/StrS family aminotransferase n=1 Tax=Candidatus Hepatobacter penaei TaxID=1274402 RepID=UPI0009E1ACD8|nr:DegT/DnrJ/EryC1/StrS family aminotransferase [Candidatus Hepatobacter penaei]
MASYHRVRHAVGVASGTDALILALNALGIGEGDEVITVSHTALATVAAVLAVGAVPVCVDIEPDFYTLDPHHIEAVLSSKTKAIMPVHLYGQPCDMEAICFLAKKHGLKVIEDCAQAVGATYEGKKIGTWGDVACMSFYPTKNLGALGDGGAVLTQDDVIADRIKRARQYGWNQERMGQEPGRVSRLDEMQAAILSVKLHHFEEDQAERRALASSYHEALQASCLRLPVVREGGLHAWHLYVVQASNRDALRQTWSQQGVHAGVHYALPAHHHPGYKQKIRLAQEALVHTDKAASRVLSLPLYTGLSDKDLARVLTVVSQ